jgi:hypothetical protein
MSQLTSFRIGYKPQEKNNNEKGTPVPIGTSESNLIEAASPDGVKGSKITKLASKITSPATSTTQNIGSSENKQGSEKMKAPLNKNQCLDCSR